MLIDFALLRYKMVNSVCVYLLFFIIFLPILPVRGASNADDDKKVQLTKKDWIRVGYNFLQCHQEKETCYRTAKQAVILGLLNNLELAWSDGLMEFNKEDISTFSRLIELSLIHMPNPEAIHYLPQRMGPSEVTLKFNRPMFKDPVSAKDVSKPDMMFLLIETDVNEANQHREVTYSINTTMVFNETKSKDYILMGITEEGLAAEIAVSTQYWDVFNIYRYAPAILLGALFVIGVAWGVRKVYKMMNNGHAHAQ